MTTPAENNSNVPTATENQFTGLYPDNTYPLVDGELDAEQEQRKQARDEHDRTPRVSSEDPYVDHPPLTERFTTNDHATRTAEAEEDVVA